MNEEFDVENIEKRMNGALESVKNDFKSLRTGRASSSILDNITVEVYGSKMPISQCATINVPEPRLITINVWDKENISEIEKSIQNSGLGNANADLAWMHVAIRNLQNTASIFINGVQGGTTGSIPSLPTQNKSDLMFYVLIHLILFLR